MSRASLPASASARLLRQVAALAPFALGGAPLAAQTTYTWLANPVTGEFYNDANWEGGIAPASGFTAVATFGRSQVQTIHFAATSIGTLRFTADASPYVLRPAVRLTLGGSGIENASAFRPAILITNSAEMRVGNSASLGDAIVEIRDLGNLGSVPSRGLEFRSATASAGSATVLVGPGGQVNFQAIADASGASFVLSSGGTILSSGGDTALQLGSLSGSGSIATNGTPLVTGHRGESTTFSGTLLAGSLTKVGAGTLTLNGLLNGGAQARVEGGALATASDGPLGSAALTLDGGAFRYAAAFDDLRALTLGAAGGGIDTQGFAVTHSTGIVGEGALDKLGPGTLTLGAANTHGGGTRAREGLLALGHDSALGSGPLVLAGGDVSAVGGPRTLANALRLEADATFAGDQALTFTGPLTLARNRELAVTGSAPLTLAGGIGESGGPRVFVRGGPGELVLTGASTYTGGTLLAEGLTVINNPTGSAFGTGAVTLAAGATLTGAGGFSGAFQNNGLYAPGNSPTLATLSSFSQGATGTLEMELGGLARGTGYDALDIAGSFLPDGTLVVLVIDGFAPAAGDSFDLFNWGSIEGRFATLVLPELAEGLAWDSSALYTSGTLTVTVAPIPEPASAAALLGLGVLAFAATRRRA